MSIFPVLIILLVGALVLLALQVGLCLLKPLWPGLILPALCLAFSVFLALNTAATGSVLESAVTMALTFLLGNVPTLILLLILLLCRKGRNSKKQLDKMNIQDL